MLLLSMETGVPEKIRAFVAIYPSDEAVQNITTTQEHLKDSLSGGAVAWTLPEQIHLTLNFLGYIQSAQISAFEAAVGGATSGQSSFQLHAERVGAFPTVRNPRILWIGLNGDLEPLRQIKQQLDDAMEKLGIEREERAFHPHLTIGRVKHLNARERSHVAATIESSQKKMFGEWQVRRIDLMRSVLSQAGARYSVLKSFPLN